MFVSCWDDAIERVKMISRWEEKVTACRPRVSGFDGGTVSEFFWLACQLFGKNKR